MHEDSLGVLEVQTTGGAGSSRLVVVGAGTMGQGLAEVAARRGIEVLLLERDVEALKDALESMAERLDREIERWALTESEKRGILSRIHGSVESSDIGDQPLILEAIPERLDLKHNLLRHLESVAANDAVFITNTSTLSITELASVLKRPGRVIGMHFPSAVHKVKVVELVRGLKTTDETFQAALGLAKRLERTAIEVFESPGYVTTRLLMPLVNEAVQVLMEGVASADDIDTAMRLGYEMPQGPLTMADRMGLDTVLSWMETLFRDLGDAKYRPCPLLRMLVRAGHLGVKTGQGFFCYDEDGRSIPDSGYVNSVVRHK
ncbi:MAG: 3-hydroxybutyryl-CoA dehydrogenase [Calditrichaeota bacterium]|nr:3-hydroxybutyryl-CoA dehydrogenase [Calditrichota bacterium]